MKSKRAEAVGWLLLWWLWGPVVVGVVYLITHYLAGGMGVQKETWNLTWQNLMLNGSGVFWVYLAIGFLGSVVIYLSVVAGMSGKPVFTDWWTGIALFGVFVFAVVQAFSLIWDADKDAVRYYNSATTFYTPSLSNPPTSLQYLLRQRTPVGAGCVKDSASDVPNRVCVGTMPQAGFTARTSSADGALLAMQRTSGSTQNVDLLDSTLVYLQGKNAWSAIRDGSGNSAHTEGVVEWKGNGTPSECYFGGQDQFDKAIMGAHLNSLSSVLANRYPNLYWQLSDVYGYCSAANRPVLVFLMREQTRYLSRTLDTPAGAVVITGSPSGAPTYRYEASTDSLPGPAYPQSMADDQLGANAWAAGRSDNDHGLFGYARDAAGHGDYLLQSRSNGHIYWVTPLTLNSSQSQLYVAYATVRADTVRAGHLNPMSIYVLASNDIRRINIDALEASAKNYLSTQVPGFFSSGGQLNDYTPLSGDVWRAFAEINGRVVYRLDISASNAIQPNLVSLDTFVGSKKQTNSNAFCGTPVGQLTQAQIVACAQTFVSHLNSNG